jgi:hypothetical protein
VQIDREGFEPFERSVRVGLGQTMRVSGALGPSTGDGVDEQAPLPAKPAAPPRIRGAVGVYALAALGVTGLNDAPLGLQIQSTNADLSVPSFGLRGGYRLAPFVAVEGAFDFARADVKNACQSPDTNGVCEAERSFSLRSLRFGPNLKLMTAGEVLRFVSGVGAGLVHHRLQLRPAQAGTMSLQGGTASGIDPYFSLELGLAFNFRHLLAELHVLALIEGASSLRGSFDEAEGRAVFANGALPMLGISLKVGYSAWAPRR